MEEQKSGQESGKQGQKPHKRRKRYSGTHPKKYVVLYIAGRRECKYIVGE